MEILKLLEDMTRIDAPSGCENNVRDYIARYAEKYCGEVYADGMGNLIARRRGSGKKIMFAAHMDEIGVIITGADKKGFLYFAPLGGLNVKNLVNLRVRFLNGAEGVIAADEEKLGDKPKTDKMFIDVGAKNREEAEKIAKTGDCAAFVGDFYTRGDTVISKALDNRAGCAALMAAMSEIKNDTNDLIFVFTAQEEVGLRGAKTAAFALEPDIAISVDTTDTGDVSGMPKSDVKLGCGAAIKVMDRSVICDASVRDRLIQTAQKNNVPHTLEIMTDGGTDAGAIHLTRAGIKTGGISVPTRYIHSVSETASISDIESCARLIKLAAEAEW